jgi:alanine dehydrogenase
MPGAVPHTSTYALTNVTLPYAVALAGQGWRQACTDDASLALGVNTHAGHLVNAAVGEATGLEAVPWPGTDGAVHDWDCLTW